MKNNELLKKYAGISTRIRRIFAYHYDQIQREVQTEISTLTPELQAQFMDLVIEYMEENPLTGQIPMTKKHSKNNYSDNTMKTIAYIMSTYHIGTHNLDIRDILESYIIARYYGWEPKEEDLEEIISHTSFFDINIDDAIYEVLTMPREKITI
ncbi:MAG: hypothetical protein [Bacteriophage sp.]|nr:MAG: hypothetical protein [Bacteriophage sp.]